MSGGLKGSLLIGLCCFVVYNANLRSISAGDTYPARYLPFAILLDHTVFLNPVANVAAQGRGEAAYWMLRRPDGRIVSLYPVVLPLLVSPLYVPAIGYLNHAGWSDARLDHVAKVMEKLTASLLAALSAALLYLLLRRRAGPRVALLLAVAYAFGTTTWVVSSQALWQHGMAQLLIVGALLLLTAQSTVPRTVAAGLLLGLIAGNRPPDIVLGAALGVYGLWWAGSVRRAALLAAAAALPMLAVLFYNLYAAGHVTGGYGLLGNAAFFNHDVLPGVRGLLLSPTRGLLVFSPFLLFLALAWRYRPHDRDERALTLLMAIGVVVQIILYSKVDWRGGLSWGPRYLTDLLPFLIWMLVPVVANLRRAGYVCFQLAVAAAIVIQSIGAFWYVDFVDLRIFAADRGSSDRDGEVHDMHAAFDWRNAPFLTSLQHGVRAPDLAVAVQGHIDRVENASGAATVEPGQPAWATGWALAGSATPWQVAVSIDGRPPVGSQAFFDRPDVRDALNAPSPSGWRIPLDTTGLEPGMHRVTAFVWASGDGERHYLAEQQFTVGGAAAAAAAVSGDGTRTVDLAASSATAAARLREHQQAAGYWLTAFTSETRFREPQPEMNTFLTAMLVDMLAPVAASTGLADSVERARQHLTDQVEPGGLVRYHGLPDAPGIIGTLGCAITPDTDNTALVWRLAPPRDRSRLPAALATLDRYRTADGLYRTWLAPRAEYQCLDPGRDPNPADVLIQIHLLQLLAEVRPAAARALCESLRSAVDEDRVWVYYQKSPILPLWRAADLHRTGCALKLPESRLRTDLPDQQLWLSVVRLLDSAATARGASPDAALIGLVLRELSRDDFAFVRTNPPLLYHNDLTATVSRYYWSEDVGYALWLRLYEQYERVRLPSSESR